VPRPATDDVNRGRSRTVFVTVALVLILAAAAAFRVWGIAWGLPHSYQDPDENVIITHALGIARGHPNPGFFLYPSFLFYAVAAVYRGLALVYRPDSGLGLLDPAAYVVDATPFFLAARLLSAACGVASVYLVYRLGRDAYSRATGLVAAACLAVVPLHVRYSHYAVTDVPATALGLLALLLFSGAALRRDRRLLLWGAVAAGLATSTKYNLGMLVLSGAVACWFVVTSSETSGRGRRFARTLAVRLLAPMLLGFVAGTPFAVLDPGHFFGDLHRQREIVARGWLGFEHTTSGYWYNLDPNLTGSIGVVLLLLGLAGIVVALVRRTPVDLLLTAFAVPYYLYVSSWHELMDRYMLPIVPILLLLGARAALAAVAAARSKGRRTGVVATVVLAAVIAAGVAVPLAGAVRDDRALKGDDTRTIAAEWFEANVPAGTIVAAEPYGPSLVAVADLPAYRAAGEAPVAYDVVPLPLPLPGQTDAAPDLDRLRSQGVQYVAVSSFVGDRVDDASGAYPAQSAFYRALETQATLVTTVSPGPGQRGPTIRIYRI
jgi:4-amino-4-deoxy-L-arabinose transferase-like glycosyltransferase